MMDERTRIVEELPGMGDLPRDALISLARLFDIRVYDNENLCQEGDDTDKLWILGQGQLAVIRSTERKGPFEVAQIQPTSLVGYAGLIDITHRTATLRAKGTVEVLEIQTEAARVMLETHESLGASAFRRALIVAMSGQLRTSNTSIGKLAVEVGIAEPDANQIMTVVPIV